jgi:hypothetical protein
MASKIYFLAQFYVLSKTENSHPSSVWASIQHCMRNLEKCGIFPPSIILDILPNNFEGVEFEKVS